MMSEFRFLTRDKAVLLWLALAFLLSAIAITLGIQEVSLQKAQITELIELDKVEQEVILSEQSDWGGLAYYTFHVTYDPPSDFAFAAMGQRDSLPWKHRIRMLALEGQIHESDAVNPDFALVGRFDFAFLLSLLCPLFVILLLYNLRSGEKSAGRLELLEASIGSGRKLWISRSLMRIGLLSLMVLIPLWIGGLICGTSIMTILKASLLTVGYLVFWMLLCFWVASAQRTGSSNLTLLVGLWIFLCAVLPTLITDMATRSVAMPEGADIIMTQRESVNDAWDLPKVDTFTPFIERHPEFASYTEVKKGFEWKWYYAFQQVGDQKAEALSRSYKGGRLKRDMIVNKLSLISPVSFVQRSLENWADTGSSAALDYEAQIRAFHRDLRLYYYIRLFKELNFDEADIKNRPKFFPGYFANTSLTQSVRPL